MRTCDSAGGVRAARETPEERAFAERLQLVRRLGEGHNAIAFEAHDPEGPHESYALKLEQDVYMAAESINKLCKFAALPSPSFVRVYGWILLQGALPATWMARITPPGKPLPDALVSLEGGAKRSVRTVGTLMELGTVKITDPATMMSADDARALLFMTLHALYVASRELGAVHGDLHEDNITAVTLAPEATVTLRVEGQTYRILGPLRGGAQYMPKLIDPGPGTTLYVHADVGLLGEGMKQVARVHRLGAFFKELTRWIRSPEFYTVGHAREDLPEAYEVLLANFSNYFDTSNIIERPSDLVDEPIVCIACGADARVVWEKCGKGAFCGKRCASRVWKMKKQK